MKAYNPIVDFILIFLFTIIFFFHFFKCPNFSSPDVKTLQAINIVSPFHFFICNK